HERPVGDDSDPGRSFHGGCPLRRLTPWAPPMIGRRGCRPQSIPLPSGILGTLMGSPDSLCDDAGVPACLSTWGDGFGSRTGRAWTCPSQTPTLRPNGAPMNQVITPVGRNLPWTDLFDQDVRGGVAVPPSKTYVASVTPGGVQRIALDGELVRIGAAVEF